MNTLMRSLVIFLIIVFVTACGGGGDTNPDTGAENGINTGNKDNIGEKEVGIRPPGNLQYIKTASIVVNELWIRDTDGNKQELLKGNSKTVQLVPSNNDFADMNLELMDLPAGEYDQVRLILESGTVLLTDNAYVKERGHSDNHNDKCKDKDKFRDRRGHGHDGHDNKKSTTTNPRLFTTEQGNLKFPSGFQSGIKANIEPPIKVVTNLATELLVLRFDLNKSFIFNGSATKKPGVKKVLFKPVIKVSNDSTHGIVTLEGLTGTTGGIKCASNELLASAKVTAVDIDGTHTPDPATTDAEGNAKLILLPGDYIITISKDGYEDLSRIISVEVANESDLGENMTLTKERTVATPVFDKDTAIHLSKMSNHAYTIHDHGAKLEECWTVVEQINKGNGTQLFISSNKSGDIIVSFAGTQADELQNGEAVEAFKDFIVDGSVLKSAMIVNHEGEANYYYGSVHSGFALSYASIKSDLQKALKQLIRDVANPISSRIYFTGHSLGGSLATIAALDMADTLKKYGYNENHIMMYSFGSSRAITHNKILKSLRTDYSTYVPNNFAVIARDDTAPHLLGLYDGTNSYYHLENLIVLNTNIKKIHRQVLGTHTHIGLSRIVRSNGLRYKGCTYPTSFAGHDIGQYTARLEGRKHIHEEGDEEHMEGLMAKEGEDIPTIGITNYNYSDNFLSDWNLRVSWKTGVQGQCDRLRLYSTTRNTTTNKTYLCIAYPKIWAADGGAFGYDVPNIESSRKTCENPGFPLSDNNKDFWVEYVDGFGNILAKKKWIR